MIIDLEHVIVRKYELDNGEPCIQLVWPGDVDEQPPMAQLIWGREKLRTLARLIIEITKQPPEPEQGG